MTTTTLVLLGLASVAVILALIIKMRTHPFIALLLVSIGLALVAGIPMEKVVPTLQAGMGKTLGSVALIVTLGAMLGKIVEVSGGADVLANKLLEKFGPTRAPWALGAASFIFGIPVFVDVAMIVLVPIVLSVAKRVTGKVNMLAYALPTVVALLVVHVVLPPHPGIVGGAGLMGADVGLVLLLGFIPAIPMWLVGQTLSGIIVKRVFSPVPAEAADLDTAPTGTAAVDRTNLPSMGTVLAMICLPLVLIMGQTITAMTLPKDNWFRNFFALIGASPAALLIGVLVALFFLGIRRGWSLAQIEDIVASALPATAAVILITGAGGTFGFVLSETGVAKAVAEALSGTGLPIILLAWLMSALIRAAQGSATVATITTAPLIAPLAAQMALSPAQVALVTIAIGVGSMALSHVNDSLFWVWSRYFGVTTSNTLKSYSIVTTAASLAGFVVVMIMWPIVSALS